MQSSSNRNAVLRVAIRAFGPFEGAIRREWKSFCEASGCTLAIEPVALDHHPLYQALFEQDGLRRGDWDVAFINTDWIAEAHESGALMDLTPRIEKDPPEDFPDGWTASLLRLQRFGDVVLGLPYHDGPECFIYREDLFDDPDRRLAFEKRYGRTLEVPATWEEFVRVARFLHRPDENLYGTVFAAYPDGHNTVYDICLQLWTRGGELFDATGRMQLDTPEMKEALAFYRAMLNDGSAIHPKSRELDSVRSGEAFARGEVAMMINWFGFAAVCDAHGSLESQGARGRRPHPSRRGLSQRVAERLLDVVGGRGKPPPRRRLSFHQALHEPCQRQEAGAGGRDRLPEVDLVRSGGERPHPLLSPARNLAPKRP